MQTLVDNENCQSQKGVWPSLSEESIPVLGANLIFLLDPDGAP